jgi:hypothetical protein
MFSESSKIVSVRGIECFLSHKDGKETSETISPSIKRNYGGVR